MAKKKKNEENKEKPNVLTGFLLCMLFAALLLLKLYTGVGIFLYLSMIPAFFLAVWFMARFY